MKVFKILLVISIFLQFSCQKEDVQDNILSPETKSELSDLNSSNRMFINQDKIPKIVKSVNDKINANLDKNKIDRNYIIIDYNRIFYTKDSLGNKNYSFQFTYKDQPKNTRYNIVYNENSDKSYVFEYLINNPKEYFKNQNFEDFNGKIRYYQLDSFLSNNNLKSGEDSFCEENTFGGGGGGSLGSNSGPSGSGGGSSGDGATYSCTWEYVTERYMQDGDSNIFVTRTVLYIDCVEVMRTTSDCTPPMGEIGMNLNDYSFQTIDNTVDLTTSQRNFLLTEGAHYSMDFAILLNQNNFSPESIKSTKITIDILESELLQTYNFAHKNILNRNFNYSIDPTIYLQYLSYKCATLRELNPTWSDFRVYWEATREMVHFALDVGGLIPVVGIVCDLSNSAIYAIEGDGVNASLSLVSAAPVVGWFSTGAKIAFKSVDIANGSKTALRWIVNSNDYINFGSRGQLRKILGLAVGDPRQAHHLITWAKGTDIIVQKAAKSDYNFHLNEALNGIPLKKEVHNGSHPNYDAQVQKRLTEILDDYGPNIAPNDAYDELVDLVNDIRIWISNNPNTPIDEIIL